MNKVDVCQNIVNTLNEISDLGWFSSSDNADIISNKGHSFYLYIYDNDTLISLEHVVINNNTVVSIPNNMSNNSIVLIASGYNVIAERLLSMLSDNIYLKECFSALQT